MKGGASDAELAALGMLREDVAAAEAIDVWPENWNVVLVFLALMTQWRIGFAGVTGLDYSALVAVMEINEVPRADRRQMFADIRVMEAAALEVLRSKQ